MPAWAGICLAVPKGSEGCRRQAGPDLDHLVVLGRHGAQCCPYSRDCYPSCLEGFYGGDGPIGRGFLDVDRVFVVCHVSSLVLVPALVPVLDYQAGVVRWSIPFW